MLYYGHPNTPMPWVPRPTGLRHLKSGLTVQGAPAIGRALEMVPPGGRICDLGAGGRRLTSQTVTVDRFVRADVDLCADLTAVGLRSRQFDLVVCTGTLEHVPDPAAVVAEMKRLAKPGGLVHIEVPFIQGYHPDPGDYWRWTLEGLRLFLTRQGLVEVASGMHMGPLSAFNWVAYDVIRCAFGDGIIGRLARGIAFLGLWPLRGLDRWLLGRPGAHRIPAGVFFLGQCA